MNSFLRFLQNAHGGWYAAYGIIALLGLLLIDVTDLGRATGTAIYSIIWFTVELAVAYVLYRRLDRKYGNKDDTLSRELAPTPAAA